VNLRHRLLSAPGARDKCGRPGSAAPQRERLIQFVLASVEGAQFLILLVFVRLALLDGHRVRLLEHLRQDGDHAVSVFPRQPRVRHPPSGVGREGLHLLWNRGGRLSGGIHAKQEIAFLGQGKMLIELFHFVGSGIRRTLLRRRAEGIEPLGRFLRRDFPFRQIVFFPFDHFGRFGARAAVRSTTGASGGVLVLGAVGADVDSFMGTFLSGLGGDSSNHECAATAAALLTETSNPAS